MPLMHCEKCLTYYYIAHTEDECWRALLSRRCARYEEALGKIADPRKRDHKEPDTYTELACVMHIANEALERR